MSEYGKIVVTGAAGFIGSNFVRLLLEQRRACKVVGVDSLTYAGNLANLADARRHPRFSFVKADICDDEAMDRVISAGVDAVVNFAAESHVDRSIHGAQAFVRTNVSGVQTLIDACRKHAVSRFLQVSTDEVYGSLGPTGLFTEETPLSPRSPYSASKTGGDLLIQAAFETFHFPAVITRCSNNYGPYQFPEKLIPLFVTNLLGGKKVPVYGDGMNVRDWIHVRDHCEAILLVLEKAADGAVYNVGGDCELPNMEIARRILKHLGHDERMIEYVKDRPGHDRRYAMDFSRLRRDLGWAPRIGFEEGLAETIEWYVAHEDWWRPIKSGEYLTYYEKQYGRGGVVGVGA